MDAVLEQALKNGIWATLFVAYFIFTQKMNQKREEDCKKTNDERELRYINTIEKNQEVIKNLSEALHSIEDIANDINEIK